MDNYDREQLEDVVNFYHKIISPVLEERLVYVINEILDAKADGHPYVNMAKGKAGKFQQLLIGKELFEVQTRPYTYKQNHAVGINFGNFFHLSNRLATFVDQNKEHDFWAPKFDRQMVISNFGGYRLKNGEYGLMFSQIDTTLPFGRPAGPQAELIVNGEQQRLFVIDAETAQLLYWQCTNWSDHWSLTYKLVRAAHGVLSMATALNRFIYLNDVQQQYIDALRNRIYIYSQLVLQRLAKAMSVEKIYKVAIVRQELMEDIAAQFDPHVLELGPPNYNIMPQPFNGDSAQAIQNWGLLYGLITNHQLYHRPWINIFERFANQNTSIAFLDIHADDGETIRTVRLENDHNFDIRIYCIDANTYILRSQAFPINRHYRLCLYPNQPQWLAYKNNLGGEAFYVPEHSHGLSGSNQEPDNFNQQNFNGNNGYQAMSLVFDIQIAPNTVHTDHRLYFVNREMAKELRYYFETQQVMIQYQRWFGQLLTISLDLTDAHRLVRQENNMNDEHPAVRDLRNYNRLLSTVRRRLFNNYRCLVKLEQIWKYSVLVPNRTNPNHALREPVIKTVKVNAAIYRLGNSALLAQFQKG